MNGIFISMEGPDGAGKTTQIELLKEYFASKGKEVLITREPGGTSISEKVREIILDKNNTEMGFVTEALLYASARAQLVEEVIEPALNDGKVVISDRFVDSSVVYQGIGRGLGIEEVYQMNSYATKGIMPVLTVHFDLPAEIGLARKKNQAELDRMEAAGKEFHEKVAEGYRTLAKRDPKRIYTIDATLSVDEIQTLIRNKIEEIA